MYMYLLMQVSKLQTDLRATQRNMKEVQNIRRDLAYRLQESQKKVQSMEASSQEKINTLQMQLDKEQKAANGK